MMVNGCHVYRSILLSFRSARPDGSSETDDEAIGAPCGLLLQMDERLYRAIGAPCGLPTVTPRGIRANATLSS